MTKPFNCEFIDNVGKVDGVDVKKRHTGLFAGSCIILTKHAMMQTILLWDIVKQWPVLVAIEFDWSEVASVAGQPLAHWHRYRMLVPGVESQDKSQSVWEPLGDIGQSWRELREKYGSVIVLKSKSCYLSRETKKRDPSHEDSSLLTIVSGCPSSQGNQMHCNVIRYFCIL